MTHTMKKFEVMVTVGISVSITHVTAVTSHDAMLQVLLAMREKDQEFVSHIQVKEEK